MTESWNRIFWNAEVERPLEGGVWLYIRPGALHVNVSKRNFGEHAYRADEVLQVELGDRFMVCGPSIEETTIAMVEEVDGCRVCVSMRDRLDEDTRTVQITAYRPRRRSRSRAA